jgi:outer membrane cobalamin receptor
VLARRSSLLEVFVLLTIVFPAAARAADETAAVHGCVTDPDGAVVPHATITIDTPAGVVRSTVASPTGCFDVPALAPGAYVVRVSAAGLTGDPQAIALAPGERRDASVALRLSAVTDVMVVTASHVEAPASLTPAAVTVFTAADVAVRQFESAVEALRLTPGVYAAQNGGRGGLTSVFPRGGDSDFTLVLVDGVRANSFGGGFDFSSLPASDIERLEIVRGPQSAVFGADAIGGVVQVVTARGGPTRGSGLVEGGSAATVRAAASAAGAVGAWEWGLSGERGSSQGERGIAPGTGERVTNDDGTRASATASLRFSTPTASGVTHARFVQTERGFPGPFGRDPNGTFEAVDRVSRGWTELTSVAGQGTLVVDPRFRLHGQVSWSDADGRFTSSFDTSFNETRRLGGRVQADAAPHPRLGLTAGVEVFRERGASTYITDASFAAVPIERRVAGWFSEARLDLADRVTAAAGLRVERLRRDAVPAGPFRPAFDAETVVSANPRVAVSWFVREAAMGTLSWTRLRGTAATGIRPPDALEIAFTDNPTLVPERSRSLDIGVEQALFDARLVIEATWFHNRYDDLIVAVGSAFGDVSRYQTDNIANARARGLETGLWARPRRWLDLRAGYTFLDSVVLAVDGSSQAPSPFQPGDALIRRPRHHGWIEGVVTQPRWSAFARFGARGKVLDVDPSFGGLAGKLEAPGFAVTDIGGSVTLWPRVAAFGRVTNLFDVAYEEAFGFPSPGRTLIGGVRVAAGR